MALIVNHYKNDSFIIPIDGLVQEPPSPTSPKCYTTTTLSKKMRQLSNIMNDLQLEVRIHNARGDSIRWHRLECIRLRLATMDRIKRIMTFAKEAMLFNDIVTNYRFGIPNGIVDSHLRNALGSVTDFYHVCDMVAHQIYSAARELVYVKYNLTKNPSFMYTLTSHTDYHIHQRFVHYMMLIEDYEDTFNLPLL